MEQLHVAIPQDSFLSTFGTRKGFPAFFISNVRLTDVKDKPFCVAVRLVTAPTLDHRRRVGHIHMSFEGDFSWEGFGAALAEKGVFAPRVTVFDGHVLLKSLLSSEDCGTGGTHEGREVLLVVVTLQARSDHQHNFLFFYTISSAFQFRKQRRRQYVFLLQQPKKKPFTGILSSTETP